MTEDPVKLYVIVMTILLCVLGFVAYTSHREASAYELAIDDAERDAKQLKAIASEVQMLCTQLGKEKLRKGYLSLIEEAVNVNGVKHGGLNEVKSVRRGAKGKEKRFRLEIKSSGGFRPLTRNQLAKLCRDVESYSQRILRTIEIKISRVTGPGIPSPGKVDKVEGDLWRGTLIFGLRVIE